MKFATAPQKIVKRIAAGIVVALLLAFTVQAQEYGYLGEFQDQSTAEIDVTYRIDERLFSNSLPDAHSLGTFRSRYGVIHQGPGPTSPFRARAGLIGTVGTHTKSGESEIGACGIVHVGQWRMVYDVANRSGLFAEQWSYPFHATQSQSWASVSIETPPIITAHSVHRWGGGFRADWFDIRSYEQWTTSSELLPDELDYSPLDQRLGTYFIYHDRLVDEDVIRRVRFDFRNDESFIGGDGGDQFQTARGSLTVLQQSSRWQFRGGLSIELFTGQTLRDRVRLVNGYPTYVTDGLLFDDHSMGLLELELGLSRFWRVRRGHLEAGMDLRLGPDTEAIRNLVQNEIVHKNVVIRPVVPPVERLDRFKTDVSLFLIYHF